MKKIKKKIKKIKKQIEELEVLVASQPDPPGTPPPKNE